MSSLQSTRVVDPEAEANAIIIRCVERGLWRIGGLWAMGETPGAIRYIETISGKSMVALAHDPDAFVFALRQIFRYGSALILREIVRELNYSTSENAEVQRRVRRVSESLIEGIGSIESGIM